MLKDVGYDVFIDDAEVIEVGRLRLHAIHNPGHTPGSISFLVEGAPAVVQRRHAVPRRAGQHQVRGRGLRHHHRLHRQQAVHAARAHDRACPATVLTPPSAPSDRISRNGSIVAGEALPYHLRPADRTPLHTDDLPPTPTRDRNRRLSASIEAPNELLRLGDDPRRRARGGVQAAHRQMAAVAGWARRRRRVVLGVRRRRPAPPAPLPASPGTARAPGRAAWSRTGSGSGKEDLLSHRACKFLMIPLARTGVS